MLPTSADIPTPRFSTAPAGTSMAHRRAMTFRSVSGSGGMALVGRRICPEKEGSQYTPSACQQAMGSVAWTT